MIIIGVCVSVWMCGSLNVVNKHEGDGQLTVELNTCHQPLFALTTY